MTISTQWQLSDNAAERYQEILVPAILGPAARRLVEWADLRSGESVLDVGCGTGAATRFAAERAGCSGHVIGADVNPGMLAVARSLPHAGGASIEWMECSAHDLPLPAEALDVALCAQTLQFLEDRRRTLTELRRVLAPGGRLAISLWCELEESPYFHALVSAVSQHIGPQTAKGLGAAFSLCDSGTLETLLNDSGFEEVEVSTESLPLELPPPRDFVPRHIAATPMIVGYRAASPSAQQAVVEDVTTRLEHFQTPDGITVPFGLLLAVGHR